MITDELSPADRADLYARLHSGNPGDLERYRRACEGATTILELGCGEGRVLRALAAPDRHLVGVDLDPGLLALARHRCGRARPRPASLRLIAGDMRTLALGRAFDRVLIPYSGIFCLADEAEVIAALSRAREHLAPGGEVIFDAYQVDAVHDELAGEAIVDDPPIAVAELRWRGRDYDVLEASRWRPGEQVVEVRYEHRPRDGGAPIRSAIRHRYLLVRELPRLLVAAGLRLLALEGGFEGAPLDEASEQFVVRAAAADG